MVHRLVSLPLSAMDYKTEYDHILHLAHVNGYQKFLIDRLIIKHSRNIKNNHLSTLFAQNREISKSIQKRVSVTYAPNITNKLKNTFENFNIRMVHSNDKKLRTVLGSTKDKIHATEKSGIYQINCSTCDAKYIGQTRRSLKKRFDEHHRSVKNKETDKAIAAHIFDLDNTAPHKIISFDENVKLIKQVTNPIKLDAYESIYISSSQNLMNLEDGPINSPLFKILK